MLASLLTLAELNFALGVQHQVTSLPLQGRKVREQVLDFGPQQQVSAAVEGSVASVVNTEMWVWKL